MSVSTYIEGYRYIPAPPIRVSSRHTQLGASRGVVVQEEEGPEINIFIPELRLEISKKSNAVFRDDEGTVSKAARTAMNAFVRKNPNADYESLMQVKNEAENSTREKVYLLRYLVEELNAKVPQESLSVASIDRELIQRIFLTAKTAL